ncbi:MAG: glycoside hydrolase family 38 C-terminal domain-containing protein, partial [Planctomycetota bacterium]
FDLPPRRAQTYRDLEDRPRRLVHLAELIPAFGRRTAEDGVLAAGVAPAPVRGEGRVLDNGLTRAEFDDAGRLISLIRGGTEYAVADRPANQLVMYGDLPRHWDAWDIDAEYAERYEDLTTPAEWSRTADGPLRAELEFRRPLGASSSIVQRVYLDAGRPELVFENRVEWSEVNTLLRVLHPVNVFAHEARYETQFGYLCRPTHRNTTWDAAKFEVCAQRWMDLSGPDHGVSLLNDAKYGHSCRQNVMGLSLLRSAKAPDPEADMGTHHFRYALLAHPGFDAMKTTDASERFNRPVQAVSTTPADAPFEIAESRGVRVDTVKPAEDTPGVVLRLYECRSAPGSICLRFPGVCVAAEEVNLLEKTIQPLELDGDTLRLHFKPFEIKSIKFQVSR